MVEPVRESVEVVCQADPEQLWPLVSDTDRLNRAAGLGEIEIAPHPTAGVPRYLISTKFGPMAVQWEEYPFEWEQERFYSVRRDVVKGPVSRIDFSVRLDAPTSSGTVVTAEVRLSPRQITGLPVAQIAAKVAIKKIGDGIRRLDASLRSPADAELAPGVCGRGFEAAKQRLVETLPPNCGDLMARLEARLAHGEDHEVRRIRPFELADHWGVDRRPVLELCLAASMAGLLELTWDVVCPSCRTAAAQLPELGGLDPEGHCNLCDITFGVEMDRAIEASFRPAPGVRALPHVEYCTGGPGATPHVVAQSLIELGGQAKLRVPALPGRYRVFVRGGGVATVEVEDGHPDHADLEVGESPTPSSLSVCPGAVLQLHLAEPPTRHVKLEHLEWSSQAATAYEVTTIPTFRRHFSREALKPGIGLRVGRAALMFSDLSASTALYAREGDAAAFRLVQDHFDLMEQCIHEHDGAVVKTIGDAVMASFTDERSALAAAFAAQRAFVPFRTARAASDGVFLKIGVFAGPCYAVTANGALDYFGQSVNVAARLQGQAADREVVATARLLGELAGDPLLRGIRVSEPFEPSLKGVDEGLAVVRMAVEEEPPAE